MGELGRRCREGQWEGCWMYSDVKNLHGFIAFTCNKKSIYTKILSTNGNWSFLYLLLCILCARVYGTVNKEMLSLENVDWSADWLNEMRVFTVRPIYDEP